MWKWYYLALAHDGVQNEKSRAVVKLGAAFHKLRHVHNHLCDVIVQKCFAQRPTQVSQQRLGARVRSARDPVEHFRQLSEPSFFTRDAQALGNGICAAAAIIVQKHPGELPSDIHQNSGGSGVENDGARQVAYGMQCFAAQSVGDG